MEIIATSLIFVVLLIVTHAIHHHIILQRIDVIHLDNVAANDLAYREGYDAGWSEGDQYGRKQEKLERAAARQFLKK